MNDEERKPRLHIHTGGLIIFIIIILILFKVDIKSKISSPQFQKNITYIETTVKNFWQENISDPLRDKMGNWFIDLTDKGVKQLQNQMIDNLKITDAENTNE